MLKMLLITSWLAMHPVHVSMISFEYSVEDKGFKVFLKVNYDDFLTDFATLKGYMAVPDLTKESVSNHSMIDEYLKQRVNLLAGENDLPPEMLNFIIDGNELKINMVCKITKNSNVFTVRNSILADIYKDQSNLVIFNYGSFEEGVKLSSEKREYRFIVKQ